MKLPLSVLDLSPVGVGVAPSQAVRDSVELAPIGVSIVNARTGKRAPIVSIEEALAHRFTADEQAVADEFLEGAVIGGPARVHDELHARAAEVGADELMLSALVASVDARRASLERIAAVMAA